jgi:polyhydroxybutyrate depolymerase
MRILTALFILFATQSLACGADTDCPIGDRFYRISMPQGHDGVTPVGAVVWSHGFRGSAAGVMRNKSLLRRAAAEGLAVIAVQGVGGGWNLPRGPRTYDSTGAAEYAYYEAVIADAASRFPIDTSQLVASGFSAGGMMVWYLACKRPGLFAGFVPYAGTYWEVPPDRCAAPIKSIVHIHGDADRTVPLKGRQIRETKQGEVQAALDHYAAHGGFGAATDFTEGKLRCSEKTNGAGNVLTFCLFPGGHSFRTEYLGFGLKQLKAVGALR